MEFLKNVYNNHKPVLVVLVLVVAVFVYRRFRKEGMVDVPAEQKPEMQEAKPSMPEVMPAMQEVMPAMPMKPCECPCKRYGLYAVSILAIILVAYAMYNRKQ